MTTNHCTCRGYDPADPCGHSNTSQGCLVHDPEERYTDEGLDARAETIGTRGPKAEAELLKQVPEPVRHAVVQEAGYLMNTAPGYRWSDALRTAVDHYYERRISSPTAQAMLDEMVRTGEISTELGQPAAFG